MGAALSRGPQPAEARGIEPLLDIVGQDMARVNHLIMEKARSDVELIPKLAQHLIDSGGKRLRPMLTIAAAKLCGYEGEGHITLAASVEFMHTATLLHDDVVDESDLRRGKATARILWGNEASVLVGDYLLGQAFKMMVDVGSLDALRVLSHAAAVIAEGEVMQLAATQNLATSEETYEAIIDAKTAALFAAAAQVGAVIAGHGPAGEKALRDYGRHLGLAFQLMDDVLDYSGERAKLGKNVGDDFREGKITLPVIRAYRAADEAERAFWQRTIGNGEIEEGDLAQAMALLAKHGAVESTVEEARRHGRLAIDALSRFPPSAIRFALAGAVEFAIGRSY